MGTVELPLTGCKALTVYQSTDRRGSFTKLFSSDWLNPIQLGEIFLTVSEIGALRGLHVQAPPAAQSKLVFCAEGKVHDVLVDLRTGSPTQGEIYECLLSPETGTALWMPPGVAHGFLTLEGPALMAYATTSAHLPSSDGGVRWDSVGAHWPRRPRIISPRDDALPSFAEYETPFSYE